MPLHVSNTMCWSSPLLHAHHRPPLLHGHHPGFHMFAAGWKGLPQSSEHPHQADHSMEVEAPQAHTDAGTYSFHGLSGLMDSKMIENSDHTEKKKTLKHLYEIICLVLHRKTLVCYSQTKYTITEWSEQMFLWQQQSILIFMNCLQMWNITNM